MLKDFMVADAVAIIASSVYIDLHNQFKLRQIRLVPGDRAAELEFAAVVRKPELPTTVLLEFSDVGWMQLSPRILYAGHGEILEIGYKEPSDRDHDWLLREEQASPDAHLFWRLADDEFIRINARRARAVLVNG